MDVIKVVVVVVALVEDSLGSSLGSTGRKFKFTITTMQKKINIVIANKRNHIVLQKSSNG